MHHHEASELKPKNLGGNTDSCICRVDDPCLYHATTCVICFGGCKGHPKNDEKSIILTAMDVMFTLSKPE